MKVKVLKKTSQINFETREENEAFAAFIETYMLSKYQDARPGTLDSHYLIDDIMRELDHKFNKNKGKS